MNKCKESGMKGGEKLLGTIIQFENHTQFKGEKIMKNKMSKVLKNEKGLTLIELLAVIVILAIISAIAIPAIGNIVENSRYNAVKSDALNVINAANLYYTDNPTGETLTGAGVAGETKVEVTVAQLIHTKYLDTAGKIPPTAKVSNAVPKSLTVTAFSYGPNTVAFSSATIDSISADKSKGSSGKNKIIDGANDANNDQ